MIDRDSFLAGFQTAIALGRAATSSSEVYGMKLTASPETEIAREHILISQSEPAPISEHGK